MEDSQFAIKEIECYEVEDEGGDVMAIWIIYLSQPVLPIKKFENRKNQSAYLLLI